MPPVRGSNGVNFPNTCRVLGCRNNQTHTTRAHVCGACGLKGHGKQECGCVSSIRHLKQFAKENVATPCRHPLCADPMSHQDSAHYCEYCGERGHGVGQCPALPAIVCENSPNFDMESYATEARMKFLERFDSEVYISLYAGMGCVVYVRGTCPTDLRAFFQHHDANYGQDDLHNLDVFLRGATPLDTTDKAEVLIKCPICRQMSTFSAIYFAAGAPKCSVCMGNDVAVVMDECKHACMCDECAHLVQAFEQDRDD